MDIGDEYGYGSSTMLMSVVLSVTCSSKTHTSSERKKGILYIEPQFHQITAL